MRKLLFGVMIVLALVILAGLGYRLGSPEIVVDNVGSLAIEEVIVQLPSSRVVFGEVPPGSDSTIYYAASQADGVYAYTVIFADHQVHSGSCGYVTNSELGKRLTLVVLGPAAVECRESNKVF